MKLTQNIGARISKERPTNGYNNSVRYVTKLSIRDKKDIKKTHGVPAIASIHEDVGLIPGLSQ